MHASGVISSVCDVISRVQGHLAPDVLKMAKSVRYGRMILGESLIYGSIGVN